MAHITLLQYDAHSFILPGSNAPAVDVVQNRPFLAFDDTTVETAVSKAVAVPGQYAGGTLKASIGYMMASATSGKIDLEVSVEAVTDGDSIDLDSASSFDTANTVNATVPATAGYVDVLTVTLANADGVAAGDMFRIKLERDADDGTDDTATGDARVLWVEIWEETS
ncbi:MAG: hypothetical protein JSU63_01770 [Phycisphaerales bacterium]|nr:MAG: hypothetical protein JSU63_01770 [Phycisphaerales bacterium]